MPTLKKAAFFAAAIMFIFSPKFGLSQSTATVTDSDSIPWVGGTYQITLVPVPPNVTPYRSDTGQNITTSFSGTLDGSGSFSVTLTPISVILPKGLTWQFTVCPNVLAGACGTVNIPVNGSGSVSSQINAVITAPRISGGRGSYAYADVEVAAVANNSYYNVTSAALRCYGDSWAACGGGGGGTVTGVTATSPVTSSGGTAPVIACTTCGVTSSPLSQFATTTSAQLAAILSDETGTGPAVFANGGAINPNSTGATTPGTGAFTTVTGTSFTASGTASGYAGLTAGSSVTTAPTSTVLITVPTSVTAYGLELPGAQPTSGNTAISCTAANPSVCTWVVPGGAPTGAASNGLTGTYPGPGIANAVQAEPMIGTSNTSMAASPLFLDALQLSGSNAGAKINSCTSALINAGGGTCDLRAVLAGGTVATSEVEIGDTTQTEIKTTYIIPGSMTFTITFNDSTKCGIHIYSGATIEGSAEGGGGNGAHVFAGSGSTMKSLLCTDQTGFPFNSYFKVGNIALYNQSGATMSSGYLATLTDGVDESHFHDIFALNQTGNAILINNTCCGAHYDGLQGFASPGGTPFATGGIPITIGLVGGAVQAVKISDTTANAPISGQPNWQINVADGVMCVNCYSEGNGATDTSTPMVYVGSNVNNISFLGGIIQPLCSSACAGKYSFENHTNGSLNVFGTTIGPVGQGSFLNDIAGGNTYTGSLGYKGNTLSLGGTAGSGVNAGINGSGNFNPSVSMGPGTGFFSVGTGGVATNIYAIVANNFIASFDPTAITMRPNIAFAAQNSSFAADIQIFHDPSLALWDVGLSGANTNGGFSLSSVIFNGSSSGAATLKAQATAGSPTISFPTSTGTLADSAASPIALNATTGVLSCPTCGVTGSDLSQFATGGAINPSSIAVGSSQALTSVQGTVGTKLPAASGTFTNGNLRSTNSTGDEIDSGIAASTVASNGSAITPTSVAVNGDSAFTAAPRSFLSASTGSLTAIVANAQYSPSKIVKSGTLENIEGTASSFSCVSNPTLTLEDCGTSAGTCASPTVLASVTLTAANTITDGTISSATLTAGHYVAWETTAGTCTSVGLSGSAEYRMN